MERGNMRGGKRGGAHNYTTRIGRNNSPPAPSPPPIRPPSLPLLAHHPYFNKFHGEKRKKCQFSKRRRMYSKIQTRKSSNATSKDHQSQQHRRSLRKGIPRKISTNSCQLQMASTAQLRQLSIEFDEGEVCFAPGDVIGGFVLIGASQPHPNSGGLKKQQSEDGEGRGGGSRGDTAGKTMENNSASECLEIVELKMKVHGGARVKGRNRGQNREQVYLDMEADLISIPEERGKLCQQQINHLERLVKPGGEKLIKFEIRLPQKGLCTSLESKSASILYTVRLMLTYKSMNNEIRRVNAVRGFTLVECFDVARLPNLYFQPASHHLTKKFGLFSCTGGQIRLHFSINRSAFVSGENIVIEGRIDNRTDRRVDKVAAVLQQVVVVQGNQKGANLNLLDVSDIHEDNLALFVDKGTILKIERNFALPPLPPSTFALDGSEPEAIYSMPNELKGHQRQYPRHSRNPADLSKRYRHHSAHHGPGDTGTNQQEQRFLKFLYQLCIRVTTGGVEVMEINVPVVIGSLPQRKLLSPDQIVANSAHQNSFTKAATEAAATFPRGSNRLFSISMSLDDEGDPMALFMQNKKETMAKLGQPGDTYICNKSELNFTNKYPFFVNLPTSSKQSRKVSILANAIRAESSFINALREEQQRGGEGDGGQFEDGNQLTQMERNNNGAERGADSLPSSHNCTPSSPYDDPCRVTMLGPHGFPRRQSTLPPVEILVEHFRRSSLAIPGEMPQRMIVRK